MSLKEDINSFKCGVNTCLPETETLILLSLPRAEQTNAGARCRMPEDAKMHKNLAKMGRMTNLMIRGLTNSSKFMSTISTKMPPFPRRCAKCKTEPNINNIM